MGAKSRVLVTLLIAVALSAPCERVVGADEHTYDAAFQDVSCNTDVFAYPTSTKEVAAHIATHAAAAANAGLGLKVRATRKAFHSTASFPCPGPQFSVYPSAPAEAAHQKASASANYTTVTLLLNSMTNMLKVNKEKQRIRVQSGMMVTQLLKEAAAANMSVPLGAVPAFGDLTLGGCLVTGAHGSGFNTTSSLADILVEMTWVDAKGNIHVSSRDSTAGRALVGGLGISGVVTELLLQLQPPSHTHLSTRFKQADANLLADVKEMLAESPHVLVVWRPDLKQYTAYVTKEVAVSEPSTMGVIQLELPKIATQALGASLAAWQADTKGMFPLAALPVRAAIQEMSVNHAMANDLRTKKKMFEGVGKTNEMQAASCGSTCLWTQGAKIAMDDVHLSIELEQLGEWIEDVQKLVDADLFEHGAKKHRYLSPGYFWLRFGRGSSDFLSHTSSMTAPVHVQMSFMKSMVNPLVPSKHAWILETIEQLTLCKYKGKPHWGKNHQRTFMHPTCHIKDNLPLWDKAMAFRESSDPDRVFEPQLFTHMAAAVPYSYSTACALRGECYCTEDVHCAPGYKCVPTLAFPEYNACKPLLP